METDLELELQYTTEFPEVSSAVILLDDAFARTLAQARGLLETNEFIVFIAVKPSGSYLLTEENERIEPANSWWWEMWVNVYTHGWCIVAVNGEDEYFTETQLWENQ